MPFQKGHPAYTANRKSPVNHSSISKHYLLGHIEKLIKKDIKQYSESDIQALSPKERCWYISSLFDYLLPKQKALDVTSAGQQLQPPQNVTFNFTIKKREPQKTVTP